VLESADTNAATTEAATLAAVGETPPPEETYRKKRMTIGAWLAVCWLAFITAVCLLAPVLPLDDPIEFDYENYGVGPLTGGHLLGTDDGGRDVLSRVIWGGRASLLIGVGAIFVGVLVGGFLGLVAGYMGGKTDGGLTSMFNIFLAFPPLVLALTLVAVLAPHPATWTRRVIVMIVAIGIVSIPILGRITRSNSLTWSSREFVTAAEAQGATRWSIMFREVLPNVVPAMLSIALLGVAIVIVIEGGLAIFGLSIPAPDPSWGNMISSQIDGIEKYPHVWLVPAVLIFLTVLALNYVGDLVRQMFDVRESVL
jgi:peptide/nickel transport system permease protein